MRYLPVFVAVALGFIGIGSYAVASEYKTVTIEVDGSKRQVQTLARTATQVLKQNGITVEAYDKVVPGDTRYLTDHAQIKVYRAHPVVVNKAGEPRLTWESSVKTGETLSIHVDGKTISYRGNESGSPRAIAVAAGIKLDPLDRVTAKGDTIEVVRVNRQLAVSRDPIAAPVEEIKDAELESGKEVVENPGADGEKLTTIYSETFNGQVVHQTEPLVRVLAEPKTKVVKVGTKKPNNGVDPSEMGYTTPSGDAQQIAYEMVKARGWGEGEFTCLVNLWNRESHWNTHAGNPQSGAYGIPQALPASKMASAGADWRDNPRTQITWGLGYITGRYQTPCGAWGHSNRVGWY